MVEDKKQKHRNKPSRMSDAEIMVVLIRHYNCNSYLGLVISIKIEA